MAMTTLRLGIFFLMVIGVPLLAQRRTVRAQEKDKTVTNSIGMKLTLIPAGKFLMGSPAAEKERDPEELQHEVAITKPFYMGVFEVTQGQYEKLMGKFKEGGKWNPWNRGAFFARGPDFPMEQVSRDQAVEFCKRLSALLEEKKAGRIYRLPTEAEWEYACRAGTKTVFHVSDTLSFLQANFNGKFPYGKTEKGPALQKTAKVGSFRPNAWGLYDMHGNVAEWCSDFYDPDYYKKGPKKDPKGPAAGVLPTSFKDNFYYVVRGGCWLDEARACRAAYRFRYQQNEFYRLVGFRVVCDSTTSRDR
jgi:formylglycine-generating enzyme required for sulfatase activity